MDGLVKEVVEKSFCLTASNATASFALYEKIESIVMILGCGGPLL